MKLIVGLGNPGEKYEVTRHNLGFRVAEELGYRVQGLGVSGKENWKVEGKFKSEILQLNYTLDPKPQTLLLVKPLTHMNLSGIAVEKVAKYFKIPVSDIVVVHDELDLPLGKIKVRVGGSAAGHHGVESIINLLGDDKFTRVRIGIGNLRTQRKERDGGRSETEKFVLDPFEETEKPVVKRVIKQAVKALEMILDKGEEAAQNQYN